MIRLALLVFAVQVSGCGAAASGTVDVVLSGGEEATRGFPSSRLEDGWSISFNKYLVSLGEVSLRREGEAPVIAPGAVVDLKPGAAPVTRFQDVAAGRWNIGFLVQPPSEAAVAEGVDSADLQRMRDGGFAYWLEGEAIKVGVGIFPFALGIPVRTRMSECTNGVDGTAGIVVPENATAETEITVHAEHMLYDRLGTHVGVKLRFEALAATAATHPDRLITFQGLSSQDIFNLRGLDGQPLKNADGALVLYEPGAYDLRTLDQFLAQTVADQAHLNGSGLCAVERQR